MLVPLDIMKVLVPTAISFVIGIGISSILTPYLYAFKMWKKKAGKKTLDGAATPFFDELHKEKEIGTPRMGGVIIWLSIFFTTLGFYIAGSIFGGVWTKFDFLSRDQTWIPLFTLVVGALVGLVDDYLEVKGGGDHVAGGLSLTKRLFVVMVLALFGALWFFYKLDVVALGLPEAFGGSIYFGWLIIPLFVAVTVFIYSGGVIDGLDGLAGGIFGIMYGAYAVIAFNQDQINLAAFCAVVAGSILAFLWFNIPPARYYMSETGSMALTVTLAVVAFMTDELGGGHGLFVLPIIALLLVLTTVSVMLQIVSKKFRKGKKIFLIAPLHHHFEATGWPSYKVTMRYWVMGVVVAILGIIIALLP